MSTPLPTAVLVHGAWHGAWCFDEVRAALEAVGMPSVAVDLPGHGADPGPLQDLHADAARVREMLDGLTGDCVLLGHSYGGAVITEAGVHPAVRHLVYLCAFAIDADESCLGAAIAVAESGGISHEGRPNLAEAFVTHDDATITLDPAGATDCLYRDCTPAATERALGRLGAQPAVTLQQAPAAVAWREKPSTYVVCTEDMAVHPDLQRVMAARCTETVEWPTSHSPFLSDPSRMSDLLVGIGLRVAQDEEPSPSAS
jgi:pimeloyl-ACP methyl ester carboxylesterase